jgi:hypothetical protein
MQTGGPSIDESGAASPGVVRFQRPIRRILVDLVVAPIASVGFLVTAWLMATRLATADPSIRLMALLPAFFGVLLAIASFAAFRRGTRRTVFEVSPSGIWSPASGSLSWDAIAEVRLESFRTPGGGRSQGTTRHRHLGIVPKDPALAASKHSERAASTLVNAFLGIVGRMAPEMRLGPLDLAPFGVADYDIEASLDVVADAVRRYVPIVDADERRARERAPMVASSASRTSAAPSITAADLRAIDAHLAPGAGPLPARLSPAAPPATPPHAVFRRPRLGPGVILIAAPVPLVIAFVTIVGPTLSRQLAGASAGTAAMFLVIPVFIVAVWLYSLKPIIAQIQRSFGPRETLAVGPAGIGIPASAVPLPWTDVAQVRTERAGVAAIGRGQAPAWRLVVEPAASAAANMPPSVRSDEIDAPFDDVLDLIRFYHPVIETG